MTVPYRTPLYNPADRIHYRQIPNAVGYRDSSAEVQISLRRGKYVLPIRVKRYQLCVMQGELSPAFTDKSFSGRDRERIWGAVRWHFK